MVVGFKKAGRTFEKKTDKVGASGVKNEKQKGNIPAEFNSEYLNII